MDYRFVTEDDLDLMAEWNHQLIHDEGHRNPMSIRQLRARMKGWVKENYRAVIFYDGTNPVAYALYLESDQDVYLRQLFVRRDQRGEGIGTQAVDILRNQIWPLNKRLTVTALSANKPAVAFWRSVGYTDYSLTLEILPQEIST